MEKKFQIGQCVIHTTSGQRMTVDSYVYSLIMTPNLILGGVKEEHIFKGRVKCKYLPDVPNNSTILYSVIELNQDDLEAC